MRRKISDAAMVYLIGAAHPDAPSVQRAAARLLLECVRLCGTEEEIRARLTSAEPTIAKKAREIACEAGLRLT